uniref:Uncharacterized protein n=1 Tax=Leersia perrieri TaxID=77586 RepID=A0A0D9W9A0_9ORYZ
MGATDPTEPLPHSEPSRHASSPTHRSSARPCCRAARPHRHCTKPSMPGADACTPASVLNLEAMDGSRHWQIVGCSAHTGKGLLQGFDWLVQDIASRIYLLE